MRYHLESLWMLLGCLLVGPVLGTLFSQLSSYATLAPADYLLNITFSSTNILLGAVPTLTLSNKYTVTAASLSSCLYAIEGDSSYSATLCSASSNSTAVSIVFPEVYPSTLAASSQLSLKVPSC